MARLRYDTVYKGEVGSTAGTEEQIGQLTLNPDATDLVGLLMAKAEENPTGAEAVQGNFIWKMGSLAFDDLTIQAGTSVGGRPATNSMAFFEEPKFVPFASVNANVGNKRITVNFDLQSPDASSEMAALASVAYSEGSIPADVLSNIGQLRTRQRWSDTDNENITSGATSEQFTNSMNIPNWVKELVAIGITIQIDAAQQADEHIIGYLDFSSGGSLPNMTPTRVPIAALHAADGTAVGGGVVSKEVILPFYALLPSADVTVRPTLVLDEGYTGVLNVSYTLYGR